MADSLRDLRDSATELLDGVTAAIAGVSNALATGTADARALNNLRATLTGLRSDLDDLRDELDDADVTDFLLYEDAAVTIRLWQWERGLRRHLVQVAPGLMRAEEMALRLVAGAAREVYIVRSGDTLQKIAQRFLGDWKEWRRIADANGIEAGTLTSGTRLIIPPKR